ncbi:MAG: 50S ribosomal protein L17 [Anaplasmataceae bacterium]|nr:50S ribosomal protein L17 [Anaplasmataceae bacterium]
MRHRVKGKKFGKQAARRQTFIRNLVANLVRYEKIETTETRAKVIRPRVERLITIGKKQNLAARRLLVQRLHNEKDAAKIFNDLARRYESRSGGYTRITKIGKSRKRDSASLATIEFV